MISRGMRSIQGNSVRTPSHILSCRHRNGGSQVDAGFRQHESQIGKFLEHALRQQADQRALEAGGLRDIILDEIRRPAVSHRRLPVEAAGMQANRQTGAGGGLKDRPIDPAADRHLAERRQQHLHEIGIAGQPFDLGDREFRILQRHDDRAAKPAIGRQQLLGHPVIERAENGRRHVAVEQRHRAMDDVADGVIGAESIERLAPEHRQVASRARRLSASNRAGHESAAADCCWSS